MLEVAQRLHQNFYPLPGRQGAHVKRSMGVVRCVRWKIIPDEILGQHGVGNDADLGRSDAAGVQVVNARARRRDQQPSRVK